MFPGVGRDASVLGALNAGPRQKKSRFRGYLTRSGGFPIHRRAGARKAAAFSF